MKIKSITKISESNVIYIDTDSLFASALPLIKHKFPNIDMTDDVAISTHILDIVTDVQKYINSAYDVYAERFHNVKEHRLFIKQEIIGKAGFWTAKKRYAVWVINKEGIPVDEIDIKGLDVVRSDFPKAFQSFMTDVLWDILKFKPKEEVDNFILNFKEHLPELELSTIMFSSSIKDIAKHDPKGREKFQILSGSPAHVRAGLGYNDILHMKNCRDVEPIKNGDKIKWTYLKTNPLRLESCALKGYKDPDFIVDMVKENIDYGKVFESKLQHKIDDFYKSLKWEAIADNSNVSKFFEF